MTLTRTSNAPTPLGQLKTEFTFEELTEDPVAGTAPAEQELHPLRAADSLHLFPLPLDKVLPMINVYGLGTVMDGRSDIEIMQSLLDIVSKNFKHNGSVLFPGSDRRPVGHRLAQQKRRGRMPRAFRHPC